MLTASNTGCGQAERSLLTQRMWESDKGRTGEGIRNGGHYNDGHAERHKRLVRTVLRGPACRSGGPLPGNPLHGGAETEQDRFFRVSGGIGKQICPGHSGSPGQSTERGSAERADRRRVPVKAGAHEDRIPVYRGGPQKYAGIRQILRRGHHRSRYLGSEHLREPVLHASRAADGRRHGISPD